MERKGNCTLGGEQVGAKEGNQSGGQTVTLLVLPLKGFWLGVERQRLGARPIGELEQVYLWKRCCPQARRVGDSVSDEGHNPRLCSLPRIRMAEQGLTV